MLALVSPGQGAQTPAMLEPWLQVPGVSARLQWASAVTGIDLVRLGTIGTADEIRDTAVAQPLLVAFALAIAAELGVTGDSVDDAPDVLAGHSVGEYAAAALSGALTPETALVLVRERGRLMAAASAAASTGMSAVLGGDADEVAVALEQRGLTAANVNTSGQVVAAGPLDALADLAAAPPAGARVRALDVAGAFHTSYMSSARDGLTVTASAVPRNDPRVLLLGNADGAVISTGNDVVSRLVQQVANPVRWDLCMQTMRDVGVTAVIELPPGGTLTGLVRRALPGVETLAMKSPADLDAARVLLQRHNHAPTEPAPSWRIAVAPIAGTFRPHELTPGTEMAPGDLVGTVVSSRDESPVAAAHGGVLVEWLAHDGDPVSPGQPVARLHPVAEMVGA
jgi:[acyl-carrier-protein] S-malonyltransferase